MWEIGHQSNNFEFHSTSLHNTHWDWTPVCSLSSVDPHCIFMSNHCTVMLKKYNQDLLFCLNTFQLLTHWPEVPPCNVIELGQDWMRYACCLIAPSYYPNKFDLALAKSRGDIHLIAMLQIWMTKMSLKTTFSQTSNINCTLVGNKLVDHSDVVGASPVGAAPTTSSFMT